MHAGEWEGEGLSLGPSVFKPDIGQSSGVCSIWSSHGSKPTEPKLHACTALHLRHPTKHALAALWHWTPRAGACSAMGRVGRGIRDGRRRQKATGWGEGLASALPPNPRLSQQAVNARCEQNEASSFKSRRKRADGEENESDKKQKTDNENEDTQKRRKQEEEEQETKPKKYTITNNRNQGDREGKPRAGAGRGLYFVVGRGVAASRVVGAPRARA